MKLEHLKYLPAIPPAAKLVVDMFFESVTAQQWWSDLPWGTINTVCLTLILSFFIQDIASPISKIRRWWQRHSSPFVIEKVIVNQRHDPERNVLIAMMRFTSIPSSSKVSVFMTPTHTVEAGKDKFLFSRSVGVLEKNQTIKFELGGIMVSGPGWAPRHSAWGLEVGPQGDERSCHHIVKGLRCVIGIEVDGYRSNFVVTRLDLREQGGDGWVVFEERDAQMALGIE
jgi:hypothetical protein